MEPKEKAVFLPEVPGVCLFRDAGGGVIYVGKARLLRNRVRSYFLESRWREGKAGWVGGEIAERERIVVENGREALALENNLIKRQKPKFNVMLRDDKTYPYIKFTAAEKYPRVYFTRRIRKDGSLYFGPYFPASLARRILHFVHKRFLVPSCGVDLTRTHPRPCLQFYIHRCLGPCVEGLTTDERYAEAARDVRMLLEGRRHDLIKSLQERMAAAAEKELYEQAASYRDLLRTMEDIEERQRIAAAQGDDTDVLAYHEEVPLVAANLFHLRGGRVVDRREFYWEDLAAFDAQEFVTSLLKQLYLEADYLPKAIHVPEEFEDRELLEEMLSERAGHRVEIFTPQRGQKRAILELVKNNAAHSFEQRFRVLKPTCKAIGEALQNALNLVEQPERIECLDISHIQGSDTVAAMVAWGKGRMNKSDFRKCIIRGMDGILSAEHPDEAKEKSEKKERHSGEWRSQENGAGKSSASAGLKIYRQNDDFASMREVVTRRYKRLQEEKKMMPGLILIDGGIGQLHAAAEALDSLGIINQPLASIAKKEEILYVYGQESEPVILERHSPVLHLIQQIRDETHRFAVTFHRLRRGKRQTKSALEEITGNGQKTARKLLKEFGSVANLRNAGVERVSKVIARKSAERVLAVLGNAAGET